MSSRNKTDSPPIRVLLVDDDKYSYEIIRHLLAKPSLTMIELQWVDNFKSAADAFRRCQHDAYLVDYFLYEHTGLELLELAKEVECPGPIIILTGQTDPKIDQQLLKAGAADYLDKNELSASILERTIRYAVERFRNELHFRRMVDCAPYATLIVGDEKRIVHANGRASEMFGVPLQELRHGTLDDILHNDNGSGLTGIRRDQSKFPIETSVSSFEVAGEALSIWAVRDISERLLHEKAMREADADLRRQQHRTNAILRSTPHALCILSPSWEIQYSNDAFDRFTGSDRSRPLHFEMLFSTRDEFDQFTFAANEHLRFEPQYVRELPLVRSNGEASWCEISIVDHDTDDSESGFVVTITDLTPQRNVATALETQLNRLSALRAIDVAITSSMDLQQTLDVFLERVESQLGVHACDVLIVDAKEKVLRFAASRGFTTSALKHTVLPYGKGFAGQAALEKRTVTVEDLREQSKAFADSPHLKEEGFVTYHALPLVARGKVEGVLEVFHRTSFSPEPAWLEFLKTLAGQAAIAVDNAHLFDELERSNSEIQHAYDATLFGWSQALELRDIETHGHCLRVTEMTRHLGRKMGISEEEMVHVQRGALLHDIGKMGIPDSILFKPGKLTEEEWEIMRKHPIYAYDLLSKIKFLQPALDIPRWHHERWDGTGYPDRLKGKDIPLSARIFAVADVCDALRSKRPYREPWTNEQVKEFIENESGKHFDPEVVKMFMENGFSHSISDGLHV